VDRLERLADQGDLDELLREVDRLVERRAWDDLARLRRLSRAALDRGHQLWPVASHVEHRLALEAPGRWAAAVLVPSAGHLGVGPVSEVAASTHTWTELAPHAPPTPVAALAAHERVVRGEPVDAASVAVPVLDLPLCPCPWEPRYPVATYGPHAVEAPRPALPDMHRVPLPLPSTAPSRGPGAAEALLDVVRGWTTGSNGRADAVGIEGGAAEAAAALGAPALRLGALAPAEALALLAWAAASGGAHGRRRGGARGRFDAWWAAAALTGLDDDWPPDTDELGEAIDELRWWWWDAAEPDTGWTLRIAVEDPVDGLAWALTAVDTA